jgi:hypothetical protein
MTQPSERLQRVLEIGDTLALFPVLRDWTTKELQALLEDLDEFSAANYKAIDEAWKQIAFKQEVFLSRALSKDLDKIRDEKKMTVLTVMSEICSVAIFYLHERGVATEVPDEG